MKSVLFICENDLNNQSTGHRVLDIIKKINIPKYEIFCGRRVTIGKSRVMLLSFKTILSIKSRIKNFDIIFIQRTSTIFVYLICLYAKLLKKRIIFDVDDAIFEKRIRGFKNPLYSCYDKIAKLADYVFAGSHYIYDYTKKLNANTKLIPTAVNTKYFSLDSEDVKIGKNAGGGFVVGWLGAGDIHLPCLRLIKKPLEILSKRHDITFKMVSSLGSSKIRDEFGAIETLKVDYGFDSWVDLKEIPKYMRDFDVSIMPLLDEPFMKGKCSLKALESMALKIPVVISGVGENNYVINNGQNGYIANTEDEWILYIEKLINDKNERFKIAENGYKTIIENYSIDIISEKIKKFLS